MKKLALYLTVLFSLLTAAVLFTACDIFAEKTTDGGGTEDTLYTITFETNGGSDVSSVKVKEGGSAELPSPTKENNRFDGWYQDTDMTLPFLSSDPVEKDMTLYAKWTVTAYNLTLELPENESKTVAVKVGESFDLSTVDGYDEYIYLCTGWSDGTKDYLPNAKITLEKDTTLTGVFDIIPFYYTLNEDGDHYIIIGNNGIEGDVVIPSEWNGHPVKEIWSMGSSDTITSLTVPDSIEHIEAGAFADLVTLTTLSVPWLGSDLTDFEHADGRYSFGYWFSDSDESPFGKGDGYYGALRNYWMPNGHYVPDASVNTTHYKDVFIPVTLKNVEVRGGVILDYAFSNMAMLESVVIGDDVTHIGANAFWCDLSADPVTTLPTYTPSLTVTFGEESKLSYLGYGAFDGCISLVSIEIPKGVKKILGKTFEDCSNLTHFSFAQGTELEALEERAFYFGNEEEPKLAHISLPETLQSIGDFCFTNLKSLQEITIPANVSSIGTSAFYGCESLTSAAFAQGNTIEEIPSRLFEKCLVLSELSVPQTVSVLGDYAFSNCLLLDEFDFSHITKIGEGTFNGCGFTELTIPQNVTKLGKGAFANNDNVTSVTFENSLTELIDTFDDCDSLATIVFPEGIEKIGEATFRNCGSLTSIEIPATVTEIGDVAFGGTQQALESITFAAGSVLEKIGVQTFRAQSNLTEITLPATLQTIGKEAFAFCSGITTVTFEGTALKTIGEGAFRRMDLLSTFTLPDGVEEIGASAFEDDPSLTEMTIPTSVTKIGANAFKNCGELTISLDCNAAEYGERSKLWAQDWYGGTPYIFSDGGAEEVINDVYKGLYFDDYKIVYLMEYIGGEDTVTLPETLDHGDVTGMEVRYHRGMFKDNKTVVTVTLPDSMTQIPDEFFSGCTQLVTVKGKKLTHIGDHAFNGCTALTALPPDLSELASVESYGFAGCTSLSITITLTEKLTVLADNAFYNCKKLKINVGEHGFDGIASIGKNAFYSVVVNGVESVLTIPKNVKSIGEKAFYMSRGGFNTVIFEDGVDSIGSQSFASLTFVNKAQKANYLMNYFLFKGTPSFIGNGFAEENYSVSDRDDQHSFKSRIYFEKIEFTQELLIDRYVGEFIGVLPWGKVTSTDKIVEGWSRNWYYFDTDEESDAENLYMPVFGKGQWTYGEDNVPVHSTKSEHFGVYAGSDSLYGYGDFIFTISKEGIAIAYTNAKGEVSQLTVTIRFAFHDGYVLDVDGNILYVFFQFDESGKVTAGIFASHYHFTDESFENWEVEDGVHVAFHPTTDA